MAGQDLVDRDDVRDVVRQKYGQAALTVLSGQGAACCGGNAGGGATDSCCGGDAITGNLYDRTEAGQLPEAALLASKNFGETSLSEIKEMMTSKNLWLGMALEGGGQTSASTIDEPESLSAEDRAMLAKPIGDLNLSVRARKCMTKLGIQSLGELLSHTGDELLDCKNFGVTSLNEVREKLTEMQLKLKNE